MGLASRLPEEISHSGARLHLVIVVLVRHEHTLFRRQEQASVHGVCVRPTQPTHVRAAVCGREGRRVSCVLIAKSRHA